MDNILRNAREKFEKITLTDNYRSKKFTKNFDKHLAILVDTTIQLAEENSVLTNKHIDFTDKMYWESQGYILEKLDTITDSEILNEFDNLEDILYERIKVSLGNAYNGSEALNLMIDNSVHDTLLALKFNFFENKDNYFNPWEDAKNILVEDEVLYTFSTDTEKLNSLGFSIVSNDSVDISDKKINIIGKGSRNDYNYGFVRDLLGLRNTIIQILDENSSFGNKATTADEIIIKLRRMGIRSNELTDHNIKSWLIAPLKRSNRIGSDKEGYFILNNCQDVKISYYSHYENFKGYYRTLEKHRKLAIKFGCEDPYFSSHLEFLKP
ncbi:hypothetical protein LUD75_12680 [Epilithonimonas sp. JDS]|uniref:hypothetical protein n=1 Tax=Epilithonimonas sp. JDS TaxID=2902797 RepID=UPI001E3D5ADE|nr:hypothetical protein [Epilithonimonas sp. JDS]MCD9855572.1 hypothetical protein [Epilithonimonas sp. JDS]